MTALAKLFRATIFRLTLVYLAVFAIFAAFLLGYFAFNTRRLLNEQITQTINTEVTALTAHLEAGGIRRLALVVQARARQPGSALYLLTTFNGEALAGNVGSLPTGLVNQEGWTETTYRRIDESEDQGHDALVRVTQLAGGFRLLVGRDLEERERLSGVVLSAGQWSAAIVVILGVVGGFFVTRRVLKRIDAINDKALTIMDGDLSGRLPVSGTGDELDRLASSLNAMLERIEALMGGLKEVSDNIAHDLKTPLTRLRNHSENALRTAKNESDYRSALESMIEESDGLIRTFNALLMIARAESGHARDNMVDFNVADIVRDVAELYEPLAEERHLAIEVKAEDGLVRGSRELLSQTISNLLDNSIKYATLGDRGVPSTILVETKAQGAHVTISVADRGPGIPATDRMRATERFVRLEQSRSQPGSGLGLSLASAVARLHGGELTLEDNRPGLLVTLVLPRSAGGSADMRESHGDLQQPVRAQS